VAEATLRLLNRFDPPPYPPIPRKVHLYKGHEIVGYTLWPSARISYRYPPDNPRLRTVVSNSDGFRNDRDFDTPHAGLRILVTGDSFVFGEGVGGNERLTDVLERLLPGSRVENLGMTGWGVDLMLRAARWISPKVRPDVLIVCVYTDDLHRADPYYTGMGYPLPRFHLENGRLVTRPYPELSWIARTRLNQARVRLTWKYLGGEFRLNGALLDAFVALSKVHGMELAIVFIPGRDDTPTDQRRRNWLSGWAKDNGVALLDLTEAIHSAGIERMFIKNNWHWNPEGHRLAAEQILALLRRTGILARVEP